MAQGAWNTGTWDSALWDSLPVTGNSATGSPGDVGVGATVSLVGNAATGTAGSVAMVVTLALSGNSATGDVGTVTVAQQPVIVIDDTHDGRRFKEQLKRERKFKEKKKQAIIDAFESIVEGRPEIAKEIAAPFIVKLKNKSAIQNINYNALFADLDRVQQIWDLHLELDDEEVFKLL